MVVAAVEEAKKVGTAASEPDGGCVLYQMQR